ncbi:hypothetical protein BJX64DRAFT_294434 [Aspergillus heterothallicus]
MGAVFSCIRDLFRSIGACIMGVVNAIASGIKVVINGIVSVLGVLNEKGLLVLDSHRNE